MTDIFGLCVKAIVKWGAANQIVKCVEELNELAVKLLHWRNFKADKKEVLEEIADVEITIIQMKLLIDDEGSYKEIFNEKVVKFRSNFTKEELKELESEENKCLKKEN